MKIKDEFVKMPKDMLYDTYLRIVYSPKDYDKITRNKMIEEIIKEYNQENYLYHICTKKELEFLKLIGNKKMSSVIMDKHEWEIKTLNEKCIFSSVTFEVFEEQKNNVKEALKTYEKYNKSGFEDVIIFAIIMIKKNAQLLTKALSSMLKSMFNIDDEAINAILSSPLFHFYCEFDYKYFDFSSKEQELINYRDYYEILDDLDDARKIYGKSGSLPFDIRDVYDTFYYGFPIRKGTVKKMYDRLSKRLDKDILFKIIDQARVLNDRYALEFFIDKETLKIINAALDDMPCAAMNGFTPREYKKELEVEKDLNEFFYSIPQNNAHLCKNAADHYYKLFFALLDYVNKKYKIHPEIEKIYKQEGLDVNKLDDIDKYLWNHKEIIDDFVNENNYKLSKDELEEIKEFKNAVTSDFFVVVGFDREYTRILSDEGKLYMVKGIRVDLDEIINPSDMPKVISTTLLMFDGKIVFKSFFKSVEIKIGNDIKSDIVNKAKNAIVHYHL